MNRKKWKPLINFYLLHFLQKGLRFIQIMTRAHLCVTGVKAEVPQFQPFFDYVEANGFEADGAYPPTGFEDTKRGKIQNVLLDKDVDAFLKEMTNDWNQAVEDSK